MKILCLVVFFFSVSVQGQDQVTLYFLPSPDGIDWSAPNTLVWSAMKNHWANKKRFLGHVFVELQCSDQRTITSMTSSNFDYLRQLILENRGLGILYYSFKGKLEEQKDLEPELTDYLEQGKVNFTRFLLSETNCKRLTTYFNEYRKYKVQRHYGMANRPLYGEGANSSAFGVSFLEVAGILEQNIKDDWSNFVNIPADYAGPPVKDEGVSFLKLMLFANKWAAENSAHKKLIFWDTDRMHNWVKEKLSQPLPVGMEILKLKNTTGIVVDKKDFPVPERPIWRQHSDPYLPRASPSPRGSLTPTQ